MLKTNEWKRSSREAQLKKLESACDSKSICTTFASSEWF